MQSILDQLHFRVTRSRLLVLKCNQSEVTDGLQAISRQLSLSGSALRGRVRPWRRDESLQLLHLQQGACVVSFRTRRQVQGARRRGRAQQLSLDSTRQDAPGAHTPLLLAM